MEAVPLCCGMKRFDRVAEIASSPERSKNDQS